MTPGDERKPRLRLSTPSHAFVLLAVVGLVAASAATGIGVALAESTSTEGIPTPSGGESLPLPAEDDWANDSARATISGPTESTTRSGTSSAGPPGNLPSGLPSDPPRGPPSGLPNDSPNGPPSDWPDRPPNRSSASDETVAHDQSRGEPRNETPMTDPFDDPPVNRTTGPDPDRTGDPGSPPGGGSGPPEDRGGPPSNRTGPPENRFSPPATRTGPPENVADLPGNGAGPPEDRSGPPANRTGPPENRTGPPENRTGPPANRTGRADRSLGPNESAPSVNVTVPNASANRPTSVNVSQSSASDADVAFSEVNVTPTKNGSFTLDVTASEAPIPEKTPSRTLTNGTEPLAFLSVDHSISDRNISNVTFRFRVRKDRINESERGEIALYRYHDESWNELSTELVRSTETHYVYRVRSPGLSEFAAGKQRPQFEITNATVELSTISVGDALEVQVRITNDGDADGTFSAELVLDDESVADRRLTIAAGGMRQTTFERRVAEPGTYEVYVNEFRVGEVVVDSDEESHDDSTSPGATDREATDSEATDRDGGADQNASASVPGLGLTAGVFSLLAALLAVRRER